jgi:hypothetical protein
MIRPHAQAETVQAQQEIEALRFAELQRLADTQSRPLTALEKVRLMHLQQMQDKQAQAQPEVLEKTFPQLLDQTASQDNFKGVLVQYEFNRLVTRHRICAFGMHEPQPPSTARLLLFLFFLFSHIHLSCWFLRFIFVSFCVGRGGA